APELEREKLRAIAWPADRDGQVLRAVQHVSHGRTGLWRRHVDRTDFLACRLVVGAQHRATALLGRCEPTLAGNHQRPGDEDADSALPSRARNRHALERRMVLDVV